MDTEDAVTNDPVKTESGIKVSPYLSPLNRGRYITFQLAEVAISRPLFADILRLIDGLRPRPAPT